MQCVACGGPIEPAANFCPSCGTPIHERHPPQPASSPSNPWAPPAYGATPPGRPPAGPPDGVVSPYGAASEPGYGTAPSYPPYGAAADSAASYVGAAARRHRRRQGMLVGAVALVALGVVVAAALKATSGSDNAPAGNTSAGITPAGDETVTGDGGVLVTYEAAHFSDRFPSTPLETQLPGSFGGVHFTVYIAAVTSPQRVMVGSEVIGVRVPDDQAQVALRSAIGSFAASSGFDLGEQHVTTFQDNQARQASLTDARGGQYTFLAFMYKGTRLYMIFAPTGAAFDSVTANFTPLK